MTAKTPLSWSLIYDAARKGQQNNSKYRVPFSKQRLAAFLEEDGWDVQCKREWIGSKGRQVGRLRVSEGHDAFGWSLSASKAGHTYSLEAWGLFRASLVMLIYEYERVCATTGASPAY